MNFDEHSVLASLVRESFYDFVREFWTTIIDEEPIFNWHIEYLCQELQEMAKQLIAGKPRLHDLVINVPPGTTKSTIVSQMFPAWVWTKMPAAKFICASYAHMVALKDSVRTRDIVQSDLYQRCFPDIQLREDENMKGLFVNTRKGFRLSVGIGGAVTGYHAHFLIVDDPLNPEEAYSEAELKSANRWMKTTLPSRKIDKKLTPIILVQQRLHQADPSGEMLAKKKAGLVKHICLPGELTSRVSPVELRARYEKGLLDPVRLSREVLEQQRAELGEYGYACQFLQHPIPLSGGTFDVAKLNLVDHPLPKYDQVVRSWDKAGTKDGGAYSVGVKMARDKRGAYWVLDVIRKQMGTREREDRIRATAEMDGVSVPVVLEIEGGSGGKESGEATIANLAGFVVQAFHPTGDKEARALPFATQVGGGNVYVLKRDWTADYIDELSHFPHSRYKDQADASSGAFNRLAKKRVVIGGFGSK